MKAYHTIAIFGCLITTTLGAAITRSTFVPFNMTGVNATGVNATAPIPAPTGAVPTGSIAPVRRQATSIKPAASSAAPSSAPSSSATGNSSTSAPGTTGGSTGGGPFVAYSGPSSSFPDPSEWASFSILWSQSVPDMTASGNSNSENDLIKQAITTVSATSGVDSRAILATIMQESTGNIRVTSTDNGVQNAGLMQSHAGTSFDTADPEGSILQMIRDGAEGTASGDGLKQMLEAQQGDIYEAFRKYNSGSVNQADLNDGLGATELYVQEMANRLMGASS